ncbi:MAG: preprotein translocase subunit SecG [Clostridiales bacterium]|nr:preprotein translocase subunit SecG [Clostridiales bacterium]
MSWDQIVLGVLLIISSILIVVLVLMQQGREAGLSGAIAGGAESFFGKNKGRTIEAKLEKITKIVAFGFFFLTLGMTLLFTFIH